MQHGKPQRYSRYNFEQKPGDMIFWRDLLSRVQALNVLRYGSGYEITLGANLALRDVEKLIEDAIKYPDEKLTPWQWHDGAVPPPGLIREPTNTNPLNTRSDVAIGTDGTAFFSCVFWRRTPYCSEGEWRTWPDGAPCEPVFWCPAPKKLPRKAAK